LAGARQLIPHYESRAAALSLNNDITVLEFMLHCSMQASVMVMKKVGLFRPKAPD
jgi:hypothetical protein